MARALSFDSEKVSFNLQSSFSVDQNEIGESASFECYADKLNFKCVWQHPDINMHVINQFMEQINIYDSNEYGDQTPSNIMDLLSSSFPSGVSGEAHDDQDKPTIMHHDDDSLTFVSSTPLHKGTDCRSSTKKRNEKLAFQVFNDASPILHHKRQKCALTQRRLEMSQE